MLALMTIAFAHCTAGCTGGSSGPEQPTSGPISGDPNSPGNPNLPNSPNNPNSPSNPNVPTNPNTPANPNSTPSNPNNPNSTPAPFTGVLRVKGTSFVDTQGADVALHGLDWFGFDDSASMMLEGSSESNALSGDFATVAWRMKGLGFNAVRLPFSFALLAMPVSKPTSSPCTMPTAAQVAASITPPGGTPPTLAALPNPPTRPNPAVCNSDLPTDTVRNRFLYVVHFFARNGFYVLIDNHLRTDTTVLTDPTGWVTGWQALVTDLTKDADTKSHLLVDILNEPDDQGIEWAAAGGKPALADLYLKAADAISQAAPVPMLFEGTGQKGLNANWGDGFCTDPQVIQQKGLSDPTAFFTAALAKPYASQWVVSPHVYGPATTMSTTASSGADLFSRLSTSFGYLTQKGLCVGTNCRTFPVVVGEFGSKFTDPADTATMTGLANYLRNEAPASDNLHAAIHNWFYWSWSPNSGDVGGLTQDDYLTVDWTKMDFLTKLMAP